MIGERKRVRKNDRFVEPDVFRPGTVGGRGRLRSRRACMQKTDPRTGQTEDALGANRNVPRAMSTALENRKPFDLRWQQGGSWKPLTAKSAKRLETIPVGAPVMPVGDGLGGLIADSDALTVAPMAALARALAISLAQRFRTVRRSLHQACSLFPPFLHF